MKSAMLCSALALSLCLATLASAAGPGQKYAGGFYGGGYQGHYQGGHGMFGGQHHGGYGPHCPTPGYDISPSANYYAQWYGAPYRGAFGVPAVAPPAYTPGPATPAVTYPYYTVRGPRDFLMANPPSLGP